MAIDWRPIAELPTTMKDGREVLVWDGENADVAIWQEHAHFGQGDPGWQDTGVGGEMTGITHFAAIEPPCSFAAPSPPLFVYGDGEIVDMSEK